MILTKNKVEDGIGIKISPFRKEIRKTIPHKHNSYFEIIYLSSGSGSHTIDSRQYDIKTPVLFFVRKEQVHHWDLTDEPDGFVIIIKKAFIEACKDGEVKLLFSKLSRYSSLIISEGHSIDPLFNLLFTENSLPSTSPAVIEGLLKALLAKILSVSEPQSTNAYQHTDLYQAYCELLSQEAGLKNNVAHYAHLLNTTPQNLNALCRKATNKSAAEVLAEFIMGEAKRLLHYSDNTVAEISFLLHFKDPSHFVKYFKRHLGTTPLSYRSTLG